MKILKYVILILILLNIPSVVLVNISPSISSLLSYLTFIFLLVYYFIEDKNTLIFSFVFLGLSYYIIGVFRYDGPERDYIVMMVKYLIIIICGTELALRMTMKELFVFLLIGASTVILHAVLFSNNYGRYSGFYLNPNAGGFICIMGYALSYGVSNKRLRLLGQLIFTFAGLLTFSRTFIVVWVLLNLISIKISIKNIKVLAIGLFSILILFSLSQFLKLNTQRFNQLQSIFDSEKTISGSEIGKDSRTETWAIYYDNIKDYPILGNGYGTFQGDGSISTVGVHNAFLLVLGEAGIIPFLIFISIYLYYLYCGYMLFDREPCLFMIAVGLFFYLLGSHNFFTSYSLILISLWIHVRIRSYRNESRYIDHESVVKGQLN